MIRERETYQALALHIVFYPRVMEVALESYYKYGYDGPDGKYCKRNSP